MLCKLKSRSGSSFLLALVFLLIVTFFGSSVLVSATGNAGRLNKMRERRQQYLAERSAALLLKEQLTFQSGGKTLTIESVETKVTTTTNDGGATTVVTQTSQNPVVTPPDHCGELQRVALEAAVWKRQEALEMADANYTLNDPMPKTDWFGSAVIPHTPTRGEIAVAVQKNGSNVDSPLTGAYTCTLTNGNRTILFQVEFAQLTVVLRGDIVTKNQAPEVFVETDAAKRVETVKSNVKTTITWQTPTIVKGGAAT